MAIIGADAFQAYPATVASISDANDAIEALKANLELLRSYGLGSENNADMQTTAKSVKNDDIDPQSSDDTLAGTEELVVIDSSGGNIIITLPASGGGSVSNGHRIRFVRTSASNTVTIARNGNTINGGTSDITVTASAYAVVDLQYNGSDDFISIAH